MIRNATFSADESKRFDLVRIWNAEADPIRSRHRRIMNLIMLNPSDAGYDRDDMTVRKGIGFATRWGFSMLAITNLTPEVSTDPWRLSPWRGIDPRNSRYLAQWIELSSMIVVAWGSQPRAVSRTIAMPELIYHVQNLAGNRPLFCIGTTKHGAPLHPSRAPYTDKPVPWIWDA